MEHIELSCRHNFNEYFVEHPDSPKENERWQELPGRDSPQTGGEKHHIIGSGYL
jgi:hypothetical protein